MGAKQIWVGLAIVVASGSLVSCGGMESVTLPEVNADGETEAQRADETAAGTDSNRSEPRGFQFESGFLEFGEFDPYAIGDDVFNPCTEITEEEFAAAGFEQMEYDEGDNPFSRGIASCGFASNYNNAVVVGGFYGGVIDRRVAEERGLVMDKHQSKALPELYTLPASTGIDGRCYTQVDTPRGAFGTYAGGSSRRITTDEACALAIEYAERIFLRYGRFSDKN